MGCNYSFMALISTLKLGHWWAISSHINMDVIDFNGGLAKRCWHYGMHELLRPERRDVITNPYNNLS